MNIIISKQKSNKYSKNINLSDGLYLSYELNNIVEKIDYISEDESFMILCNANISFVQNISNDRICNSTIEKNISTLKNGFAVLINKKNKEFSIYTDIFGLTHLYYIESDQGEVISNDFNELASFSTLLPDSFAFLDMFLFNYTLLDRTVISDIKRVPGGSILSITNGNINIEVKNNYANNFKKNKSRRISVSDIAQKLENVISNERVKGQPDILSVTGGFDSRTLLAIFCKLGISFESFTFGQLGNLEIETIKPFVHKFSKKHELLELDDKYVSNLRVTWEEFLQYNLDCPVSLDLPHYIYVKENIPSSNLYLGYMGGEMLSGQSIGSQVTFTSFAARLLKSSTRRGVKELIFHELKKANYINSDCFVNIIDEYIDTLATYFYSTDNFNILRFLINEKFSKFFGAVNKVFLNHSNFIVPFMDPVILDTYLSSNLSFLNKKPFEQKPLANLKRKVFNAKLIKRICPALSSTRLDRLYSIGDLCNPLMYPFVALGYFRSHFLKANKTNYPRPHFYDKWYKEIAVVEWNKLKFENKFDFLKSNSFEMDQLYMASAASEKKKIMNVISWVKALEAIRN